MNPFLPFSIWVQRNLPLGERRWKRGNQSPANSLSEGECICATAPAYLLLEVDTVHTVFSDKIWVFFFLLCSSFDPFQLIQCKAFGEERQVNLSLSHWLNYKSTCSVWICKLYLVFDLQEPFRVIVCAEALVVVDVVCLQWLIIKLRYWMDRIRDCTAPPWTHSNHFNTKTHFSTWL